MYDFIRSHPVDVLFEDQVTLSDGRSKPYPVLLQLTAESLIIRTQNITPILPLDKEDIQRVKLRHVTIKRHPITHTFGFSIKGGNETGFPILISRVIDINAHFLNIGDAILSINNDDISNLNHDQVIKILRDLSDDHVHLTVQYMKNMATYLHLTSQKFRPSESIIQNCLTIQGFFSNRNRRDQRCKSAIYPSEYQDPTKQLHTLPTMINEQKNRTNSISDITNNTQEYSLLYAFVSQYIKGINEYRINAFQIRTLDGSQTGIIITNTSAEQNMWVSRINTVIQNLTARVLAELNQTLLSCEQIFYAGWVYERVICKNERYLPEWKAIFIVFKGCNLYIFNDNQFPPLSTYDFICCTCIYPLIEIFIETIASKCSIDDRRHYIKLLLPNNSTNESRYLSFERKIDYNDFILNYHRALYVSIYTIQNRIFGCSYQGQICRFIIDIHKGFEMYNNKTSIILWAFTFEQLLSSSDNGRDRIYLQFKRNIPLKNTERIIQIEIQCQHLRTLIHVINSFLTVKFINRRSNIIG